MSDKLLNNALVTTQVEFDEFGSFKMTEVLDASVLEAIGGGASFPITGPINFYCPTNNCPPPTPTPPPAPTPTPTPPKPPEKPPEQDGDES